MSLRVLSERLIRPEFSANIKELMTQLRSRALWARGFVHAEALTESGKSNSYIVLSSWHLEDDWHDWLRDPERLKLEKEIDKLTYGPAVHRVLKTMPRDDPKVI
eukprot:TRINITY_DN3737_c0_g1_i1.p2 TRINITY_DN3737_c0_g1~~TRINITY_DN3737_c0_g1_i1.p2  ORF type:complete len:104 (+),score=17.15 TRINITY_DN3737_c0_g1_i1:43-354(+)